MAILAAGDTDNFTLAIDSDQTITAIVTGSGGLQPSVKLRNRLPRLSAAPPRLRQTNLPCYRRRKQTTTTTTTTAIATTAIVSSTTPAER